MASPPAFPKRSVLYERELETSPSLHRLHTTNFSATEQEASHIQNTILPSIDADISSMVASIAALQATLDSMKRERDALEAVRKQHSNLIHPRRAVPPELWSEIFLFVILGQSRFRAREDFDPCDPCGSIWELSHVCRPWRGIVLSLHALWSMIVVDSMPFTNEDHILELVLQRTGQHSLNVTLKSDDTLRNDATFENEASFGPSLQLQSYGVQHPLSSKDRLLGILFAESPRWRTLKILGYNDDSDLLYAPLSGRLTRLESLSLHFPHVDSTLVAKSRPVILAFRDCPRLTKVALTGERRPMNLPYATITDLYLEEPLLQEDYCLVGQCTSLEKLRIIGCRPSDHSSPSSPLTPPLMNHANLHKLTTSGDCIINSLTLPQLEEAVLYTVLCTKYDNLLSAFDRLLRRSHCTRLTRLSILNLRLVDHLLTSVLSQTPSLTSLHLDASMADADGRPRIQAMQEVTEFLRALQVTPQQNPTFLPRVSFVKIRVNGHMDSTYGIPYFGPRGSFSSMVMARWAGDTERGLAKLETFHFSVWVGSPYRDRAGVLPHLSDDVGVDILSGLVEDGMDLTVRVNGTRRYEDFDPNILNVGK